jgi:integrase
VSEIITNIGGAYFGAYSSSGKSSSDKSFSRVLDSNNQPIRGLWRRRKLFYARMSVTDATGRHTQRRVPLKAKSLIQAQAELEKLRQSRTVPPQRQTSPIWSNYWHTYISQIHQLKRPRTVDSEKLHCEHWAEAIGKLNIHLIRKSHLLQYRSAKLKAGWAGRTVNLAITVLSNVLNHAQDNGLIDTLPTTGLKPIRWKPKKRPLFALEQIEAICIAAIKNNRNGQLLADYVRLMARCGSRASETLRLMWSDVDWGQQQLTIGSDGLSKNHESRAVDFNAALAELLEDMRSRSNGSAYLFPAPRMFGEDAPARSLKEALYKARALAGVDGFGYHDCRHYFISHAVMSGIDYMTIARWVGHKDGGVLIGRVYGHLNDEHAKRQAKRLKLG